MNKNILILGAGGQIARIATEMLLETENIHLTLYLRKASRLKHRQNHPKITIIEGDVLDQEKLNQAMAGQDIVYANIDGKMAEQAENIIHTMNKHQIKRLVFISAGGIYNELPGEFGRWNNQMLGDIIIPYRRSVELIEASDLDYTVLRPVWLTNIDEIDYETTLKGEMFKGTEVSRKSVADLVKKIILNPEQYNRESLGVNKPNTDGDKPRAYR